MSSKPRIEAARIRHEASLLALLPADAGVRKTGHNQWRSRCPLHRGTGLTFAVWYDDFGWTFNCFACGEKGSVIDFAMKADHVSFHEALDKLSGGELQAVPVALWAAPVQQKAYVLGCEGKGCGRTIGVDLVDVPYLGLNLHNSWVFKRHADGQVDGLCARCVRGRYVGRMNTSGTEAGAGNVPAAGCREAGTGLADSPKTPRRPNA